MIDPGMQQYLSASKKPSAEMSGKSNSTLSTTVANAAIFIISISVIISAAVLDKWPRRSFPLSFMFPPSGSMHTMPPVTGNTRAYNQVIIPNVPYLCKIIVNGG